MMTTDNTVHPSFGEALKVWLEIGCINFGGPAGQIAMMHRILVDEKKWIDEARFLHALNFSMLLPGPEATQLATYVGWLMHGVRGGLAAGILFVLPGAFVMLGLSLLYAYGRGLGPIDGALFGIKAAVLVIVFEALIRIGKRSLKSSVLVSLAALAFISIFFFAVPFPLIVIAAALAGYLIARSRPDLLGLAVKAPDVTDYSGSRWRQFTIATIIGLAIWWVPVALAALTLGPHHILVGVGIFFSKLAVVTFGGAYAVLAYMAQQVVETNGWLTAPEMVDALGLAERVHHFRRRQPTVRLDHLLCHIGQHGISAAEGHHRELGEKYPDADKNMVRPQGQRGQCNGRPPDCETNDCGDCELPPTTAGIIGDIRRFDGEAEQIRTRPGDKITGQRCGNHDQRKRHGEKENADKRQRRERNQKR